jgi:hypothetical protein
MQFDLRTYVGRLAAPLHDIRAGWRRAHDPNSYVESQALAKGLRAAGSNGIAFDSVRRPSAENIAIFRPSILAGARSKPHTTQGSHVRVEWDGERMSRYIVMGADDWTYL